MGCSFGKDSGLEERVITSVEFKADLMAFQSLKLSTEDACKLYRVYVKLLSEDMKSISHAQLLDYVGLTPTPFIEEILSIQYASNSEELNFRDFVVCVWNYCTLTHDNMG